MALGWQLLATAELRRGWSRAATIGLLAAVTTFCLGRALWTPPTDRALVQAVIEYQAGAEGQAAELDLDKVRAELLSPAALQEVDERTKLSQQVPEWQQAISVHRGTRDRAAKIEQIVVDLPASEEAAAIAAVQQLTRRFLQHAGQHSFATGGDDVATAWKTVSEALAQEDIVRRQLDAQVRDHFAHLRQVQQAPPAALEEATVKPTAEVENPAWEKLQAQIAALEAKRDSLLAKLTPAHPQVQDVDSALEELRSREASVPRYLEPLDEEPSPTLAARPEEDHEALLVAARAMAVEQGQLREALDAYEAARATRLEAQAAVEVLQRSTAAAATAAPRFSLAQSAQVVERFPSVAPPLQIALLLALSALVLLVVTFALRPRMVRRMLASADDVARLLLVPVVAHVKLGNVKSI
jgi:hypothetical protein